MEPAQGTTNRKLIRLKLGLINLSNVGKDKKKGLFGFGQAIFNGDIHFSRHLIGVSDCSLTGRVDAGSFRMYRLLVSIP